MKAKLEAEKLVIKAITDNMATWKATNSSAPINAAIPFASYNCSKGEVKKT